jgi:hypothetical protein
VLIKIASPMLASCCTNAPAGSITSERGCSAQSRIFVSSSDEDSSTTATALEHLRVFTEAARLRNEQAPPRPPRQRRPTAVQQRREVSYSSIVARSPPSEGSQTAFSNMQYRVVNTLLDYRQQVQSQQYVLGSSIKPIQCSFVVRPYLWVINLKEIHGSSPP